MIYYISLTRVSKRVVEDLTRVLVKEKRVVEDLTRVSKRVVEDVTRVLVKEKRVVEDLTRVLAKEKAP